MKFHKGKYTKEQQAWCENYEARTDFDPLMDDFEAGNETFYEAAQKSIRWFEDHSSDALNSISHNVPGWEAALDAEMDARDAARHN
ncbi:hypothetical protein LMG22037_05927 [Paraburkholderia phenoliruptrix]|uniref:Uncharacterized protein n=1 Tax=Paraburkholderia phenoliruptrix TaxID=252970 RepID=A0A6J5CFP4_9BURK|nr:hypothetical protein [Paraburkholderia phenoliruptrix]CAB3735052.1 hypothetical protein LMG22037_05927 [Paraburkholderia phenoliruptrix]